MPTDSGGLSEREFNMASPDDEQFQHQMRRYLQADKRIAGRCVWKRKQHPDYREVVKIVECSELPEFNGELRMTAHLSRVPQKFGFVLLLGTQRVLSLDVDPGRTHFNVKTLVGVSSTHWQEFPEYEAIEDGRDLNHQEWLVEICKRSNIRLDILYRTPPHEPPQLILL